MLNSNKPTIIPYWNESLDIDGKTVYKPNTNFPSIEEVRNSWCFGLPLNKEDGSVMPDYDIKLQIDEAIAEVERKLGIYIKPTIVASNPWERGLVEDVDYEIDEPPYDYDAKMWKQYGFLQLREKPLLELNGFKMVLPNGQIMMDFFANEHSKQWIKMDKNNAQLNVVPYAGDPTVFAMMGSTGAGYPFVTGRLNSNLPQMFYIDYVTGYAQNKLPKDIGEIIAKIASMNILGIAGDALLAGVASLSTSIDGLSESFSTTASATSATYGAHIKQYQDEVKDFFSEKSGGARSAYRGFTITGF